MGVAKGDILDSPILTIANSRANVSLFLFSIIDEAIIPAGGFTVSHVYFCQYANFRIPE